MMGNRKVMIAASIFLIAACACGCGKTAKYKELSVPAVAELDDTKYELEKAKKGDIYKGVTVDGLLVPVKEYSLSFYTTGAFMKDLYVKDGDAVQKGQVLAEIDTDSLKNRISLEEIRLKKMKLILENLVNSKAKETALKSVQLDIEAGELRLENLKKELVSSKLISNISGKVFNCGRTKPGEMVRMSQPIMTIADTGQMQIECSGEQVKKLRIGMKVKIDYKNNQLKGEVVSLDEAQIKDKLEMVATVNIEKLPKDANIHDTVKVTVELGMKKNVIIIPKNCIRTSGEFAIVQVMENGSKVERFVEIGVENDSQAEVVSGLSEGEEIIKFK